MLTRSWVVIAVLAGVSGLYAILRSELLTRWRRMRGLLSRASVEDALKFLHTRENSRGPASPQALAGSMEISTSAALRLIKHMEGQRLLRSGSSGLTLTALGHSWALQVIRAHRLWERYLADEVGTPWQEMHSGAELQEHLLTPEQVEDLDAHLGHPRVDPHGDPIPSAKGEIAQPENTVLTDWPAAQGACIVHVEDEPPEVFEQIIAEGLLPGVELEIISKNDQGICVRTQDGQHLLAPLVALNIFVAKAAGRRKVATERLTALKPGQFGRVVGLECHGLTRRRFLDLGLTPGVLVSAELKNSFGDPTAYRIRGTLVALRHEQAEQVLIAHEKDML